MDTEGVRITALQVIFDLLHIHGLDVSKSDDAPDKDKTDTSSIEHAVMELSSAEGNNTELTEDANDSSTETKTSEDRPNATAAKIVAILTSFLDKEVYHIYIFLTEN